MYPNYVYVYMYIMNDFAYCDKKVPTDVVGNNA